MILLLIWLSFCLAVDELNKQSVKCLLIIWCLASVIALLCWSMWWGCSWDTLRQDDNYYLSIDDPISHYLILNNSLPHLLSTECFYLLKHLSGNFGCVITLNWYKYRALRPEPDKLTITMVLVACLKGLYRANWSSVKNIWENQHLCTIL